MIDYNWQILDLYAQDGQLSSVRYLLSGNDGTNIVQSEGKHQFSNGLVNKPLAQIVESDIVQWIEKDTTQDDVNAIKLAIENQLKSLETSKKVDFPWLINTFTIE